MGRIMTPDGDPFGRDNSLVDTRSAVLLEDITVVALTNPSDQRDLYGIELEGRVNRSSARSDVMYLVDPDGAAALVADIVGMFSRAGEQAAAEFQTALDQRLDALPTRDGDG